MGEGGRRQGDVRKSGSWRSRNGWLDGRTPALGSRIGESGALVRELLRGECFRFGLADGFRRIDVMAVNLRGQLNVLPD